MLKTLDKYIDDGRDDFSASLWKRISRDHRFDVLLALSVICHIVFYVVIVWTNYWEMRQVKPARRSQTVLVEVARLGPLPATSNEDRAKPDPIERADMSQLEYDPDNPDDTHLIARSPNPTIERGSGGATHTANQNEIRSGASVDKSASSSAGGSTLTAPPALPAPLESLPKIDTHSGSQTNALPNQSVPVPSSSTLSSVNLPQPPVPAGSRQGAGPKTTEQGIERTQAMFVAYVREKIRRVNERNMPTEWIKDMLDDETSAIFELKLRRGGFIQSLTLYRPSRYRLLDERAREAINIASPFEGYPQSADDTITITVTVHYFPLR